MKILQIITQTVWSFDPCKSQWSNENRLPFKRRDFALVGIENGFYVIGGEEDISSDPVSTTLFYNISSKIWEKVNCFFRNDDKKFCPKL